jgi:hypothetical protein
MAEQECPVLSDQQTSTRSAQSMRLSDRRSFIFALSSISERGL